MDNKSLFIRLFILLAFLANVFGPLPVRADELVLPKPGTMIALSTSFYPAVITGMTVHPENPLQFDFIIDTGDDHLHGAMLKKEANKLINYFMATLTVPDDEMWVNLSPYEKNRIIADGLSKTEMGRDMLAQDYILKQLTASLIYPESSLGKEFWRTVYAKAQAQFGTTQVPTNLFNKVWIVPQDATVYVHGNNVFVTYSHLKVMLEEDYLSLERHSGISSVGDRSEDNKVHELGSQVVRQIVLPELEKEVNGGKNFANLRQIYNSMILATWYKKKLKASLFSQVYLNKNKTNGIELADKTGKDKIYLRYLQAYKKGVFNFIKEEMDPQTKDLMPRKYFSGGLKGVKSVREQRMLPGGWLNRQKRDYAVISMTGDLLQNRNAAMLNFLSRRQAMEVDEQYNAYRQREINFFMQRAKPGKEKSFSAKFALLVKNHFHNGRTKALLRSELINDIINDFSKETTPPDTMYQITAEDSDIIEGLKSRVINNFDFEVTVFRVRGTKTWIFIKGTEKQAWGEVLKKRFSYAGFPYDIFDIAIHTHPETMHFPVPSLEDLAVDLRRQLRDVKLYIRGPSGLTLYEAHRLTESEFSFSDYEQEWSYLSQDLERNIKKNLSVSRRAGANPKDVMINSYEAAYKPFLENRTMALNYLTWDKVSFPKVASFALSKQLQSESPEERLSALYVLFHLFISRPSLAREILPAFNNVMDERLQLEVLNWVIYNIGHHRTIGEAIVLAFRGSPFAVIRALAVSIQNRNKNFIRLMNRSQLLQELPHVIGINRLDQFRIEGLFVRTNELSDMIFAAERISRGLAKKIGKPLLNTFLERFLQEGSKIRVDPKFFLEANRAFRYRWGLDGPSQGGPASSKGSKAMLIHEATPGGIDLNANNLDLKEQGKGTGFYFKDLQNIHPDSISGVLPVITKIQPVNLRVFFVSGRDHPE